MKFDDIVRKTKMVSKYLPKKIPDRIIGELIMNFSRSPRVDHIQVQEFIIVKNPAVKNTTTRT
jgi:hypothetical protein